MAYSVQSRPHGILRRLVSGLFALIVISAILVGAPMALAEVAGNPLPQHMPTLDEISGLLSNPDNGTLFMRFLALVGWVAWATFAIAVLIELPARLAGRRAVKVPGLGVPQRMAAVLIGAIVAVFAGASVATAMTAPSAPVAQRPTAMMIHLPAGPVIQGPMAAQGGPALQGPFTQRPMSQAPTALQGTNFVLQAQQQTVQPMVYEVSKGDYLGRIAQRFCGDFDSFHDIAALNPQLVRNPNHIEPGWRLILPLDAQDRGVMSHATGNVLTPQDQTPPPVEQQEPAPQATPSNPPVQPTPSAAPSRSYTPPTTPILVPAPSTPAVEEDHGDPSTQTLAAGAGLAAAGVIAAHVIVRRRIRKLHQTRVQRRRVAQGFVRVPQPVDSQGEQNAKHRAGDRLDSALRRLTIGLHGRHPQDMPDIAAAWQHGGDLAMILAQPSPAPPQPFHERGTNTWSLPGTARLPDSTRAPSLLPALLRFATWPQGGELLVDGERPGLLTITGDSQCCDNLLRFLAAEAAHASWNDSASVLVAGLSNVDTRALTALSNGRIRVTSINEALARVSRRAASNAAVLRETGTPDTMSARIYNVTAAAWSTHLVFIADPWGEHTDQLMALDAQLSSLGRVGVSVIATHPTPTRWSASVRFDGTLDIPWLAAAGTYACQMSTEQLQDQASA